EVASAGISAMRDDVAEGRDWFHFLNTNALWIKHTATIKPVATLNPRLPGFAERRSSERVGMDTSANEITKIAIPSAFSDEWLCLWRRAINIFRRRRGT